MLQGIGDMALAYQCFRLALAAQNDHPEAYNNLGVLEMRKGHNDQVIHLHSLLPSFSILPFIACL